MSSEASRCPPHDGFAGSPRAPLSGQNGELGLPALRTAHPCGPAHVRTRTPIMSLQGRGGPRSWGAFLWVWLEMEMPKTHLHGRVLSVCCVVGRMEEVRHLWRTWSDTFSEAASGAQGVGVRADTFNKVNFDEIRLSYPRITHSRAVTFPAVPQRGDLPFFSFPLKRRWCLGSSSSTP